MSIKDKLKSIAYYLVAILSTSFTLFAILIVVNASCNRNNQNEVKTKNQPKEALAGL